MVTLQNSNYNKVIEKEESPIKFKESNFQKDKDFIDKFTTIKRKDLFLLKNFPETQNNYTALVFYFWGKTGQANFKEEGDEIVIRIKKNKLNSITSPESITRPCRSLFEEARKLNVPSLNFLQQDDETLEKRQQAKKITHGYFGEIKI